MSTVTAGWPLPKLISALARAGWADVDTYRHQSTRSVIRALGDLLPHQSAEGQVTFMQIADATGLTGRWTRVVLYRLEAAGLIVWTRGQLIAGKPTPGHIKVNKKVLALLVRKARGLIDDRLRARADDLTRRLADTLRMTTQLNRKTTPTPSPWYMRSQTRDQRKPLSEREELSSTLPPTGEETEASGPVVKPIGYWKDQLRSRLRGATP